MKELTLLQIITYAAKALVNSEVFILIILELAILLLSIAFSRVISKKFVKTVAIGASLVLAVFYGVNYLDTLSVFMNNVSTKVMEYIYFPSTIEFLGTMIASFGIMLATLANKNEKKVVKIINTAVPITISFIFLSIIEYMNTMNIDFNEFSVFTEPVLMSLNELAIGLFVAWLISLVIYKVDTLVIKKANAKKIVETNVLEINEIKIDKQQTSKNLVTVNLEAIEIPDEEEEIEMPKLRGQA